MLTRRGFVRSVGLGAAGALTGSFIGARGREHSIWSAFEPALQAIGPGVICLASNENPLGPGPSVLNAVKAAFGPAGTQPGRYAGTAGALIEAIAGKLGVRTENVVLGCGSTQILRSATHLFTARDRPLVGTIPTYEECAGYAELMQHPVRGVPLTADFKTDLDRMAGAAKGAGLLFYCNPNNPTATFVGARATRDFIARVTRESPETTILVDEAYFDYVTDPDHDTQIPIALENPRVLVARTFS
jgi:histidinol-phosphate aminotransferase